MVSVIINTINEDPATLLRAVESYRRQGAQIIVSTIEGDASLSLKGVDFAIMKKEDHVGKSPRGSFMQLNNALPLIKGQYFCFASGNDYAQPTKLRLEVDALKESGAGVCYSSFYTVTDGKKRVTKFFDYDYNKHLKGNFVSDCALISKELVDKYLPFNIELNNYAYWDLWLRIYKGEGKAAFVYQSLPTWNYIQRASDMHNLRKVDAKKQRQARIDRAKMLALHL